MPIFEAAHIRVQVVQTERPKHAREIACASRKEAPRRGARSVPVRASLTSSFVAFLPRQ